jgi:hypothetical protein
MEKDMSRGRSPEGETALSNAERQARYRDRHKQAPVVVVQSRKPADRRPRPRRWHDAVTELLALQAAYAAWFEALPDPLRGTATADALEAIVELDLDTLAAITPPRGYGRD